MSAELKSTLICNDCQGNELHFYEDRITCTECRGQTVIKGNIPRFISDDYHENWGYNGIGSLKFS